MTTTTAPTSSTSRSPRASSYSFLPYPLLFPFLFFPQNISSRCINAEDGNTIETTICYDDYNSPDEFHFALASGVYNVTVGIGWPGACREDTEFVSVNNVVLRNVTCDSTDCCNVREYWGLVDVYPGANGAGIVMTFGNDLGREEGKRE
jgi:hypothetical protein